MSHVLDQGKEEAIAFLRERIQPGTKVYMIIRHRSQSGMSRVISSYVIERDCPIWLDPFISRATGYAFSDRYEGVKIGGAGMDMGFALLQNVCAAIGVPCESVCHKWL